MSKEFFEAIGADPDNPGWEYLRMVREALDTSALCAWYFLKGLTYGDDIRADVEAKDLRPAELVAYELGVTGKPIRDEAVKILTVIAIEAIKTALIKR